MQSTNRLAVVVKPKQPFIDWLNSIPDDSFNYTLEKLSTNNISFLIPIYDHPDDIIKYIRKNCKTIFEWELWGWITAKELWPKNINWKTFNEWFDIEVNSEVFDLVSEDIEKEEV